MYKKKVTLCVLRDIKGVALLTLLPHDHTVTADVCCDELQYLVYELKTARPQCGLPWFPHDNARHHVARVARQKLLDLG